MRDLVLVCMSILAAIILIGLFWDNNFVLTLFVTVQAAFLLKFCHEVEDLISFFFVLIVGSISEIAGVSFGAWTYNNPSFLGIPIWLPLIWGMAALCLRRFVVGLKEVINR